jgi:molybdate transport system permease protein
VRIPYFVLRKWPSTQYGIRNKIPGPKVRCRDFFVVVNLASFGFASIDTDLEQAAALDGASAWQVFRYVSVPLSWSALLSGSVMSWARALGEFGATIIFAGNLPGRTQTMPLAIYIGFQIDLDVALTLSVILVGFSFLALLAVRGSSRIEWT